MIKSLIITALAVLVIQTAIAADAVPVATSSSDPRVTQAAASVPAGDRMAWFREAKFGMFIHWGLYSVLAGSWQGKQEEHPYGETIERRMNIPHNEYAAIADTWEPKQFDADAWVKVAKDAGMKYLVITVKHHDGFLMYPSKLTDYSIGRTPWKRDPVKELSEACARNGLKFGVYFNHVYECPNTNSLEPDWFEGEKRSVGRDIDKYINEVALPQLRELLVNHPLINLVWFDTPRATPEMTYERGKKFADLIHSIRPDIIFNSRLGGYPADFASKGDNQIPKDAVSGEWETCGTINRTWGYKAQDTNFKSATNLIHNLIEIAGKGGNYLLNVGPTGEGVIPAPELERLKIMGDWLKVNGESIYGTRGGPYLSNRQIASTCKGNTVFLHILAWPATGDLRLPALPATIKSAALLTGGKVDATVEGGDLVIKIAPENRQAIDTLVKLELDQPAATLAPIQLPASAVPPKTKP